MLFYFRHSLHLYISISTNVIWNRKLRCKCLRRRALKRWKQCKWVSKYFTGYLKVISASDSLFVVRGNVIHDTELIRKPDGPQGLSRLAVECLTPASLHESKQSGWRFENETREIFWKKPLVSITLHGVGNRKTVTHISRKFILFQATRRFSLHYRCSLFMSNCIE
jgi:hypothetical protein